MTSTSKSGRIRGIVTTTGGSAVQAAKVFSGGAAGVGLQVSTRGLKLARREIARRKQSGPVRRKAEPRLSPGTKRILIFGALFGTVAGITVLATRRRNTFQPPADAPPSLADYDSGTSHAADGQPEPLEHP
ncbi:hypothetical protein O1W68_05870 [Rhodococcus sp. H36-A4]|uniref:hypothetical protein n=1 Tax=Rhodococcus sp. H36-A4 TaxID=3004353 RepID=UPI0022AFBA67|nr:hypothetical protein [Rhodococcus sp. H36-A4]MCZ4077465.1 hypothetical protein [Rhodococcus sp. H36-A4]